MMIKHMKRRGQATVELALSSLILVTIIIFGIYFGEVTFGALKVQEASNSALFDMTHYKVHNMLRASYSNARIGNAVTRARNDTFNDYQDFDGRTSPWGMKSASITHVFTGTEGMRVNCVRGGGPGYGANPLIPALVYDDNSGASCSTEADFLTTPQMPTTFMEKSQGGFFSGRQHWTRAVLKMCGTGKASFGVCRGRYTIMLDDWGLTGPGGGEWLPAPGLIYGLPSVTNPSYWWTGYKAYMTSYMLNALFKPIMFTLPASQLAMLSIGGIHPMGIASPFPDGITANEAKFYMSFNSSLTLFEHLLIPPLGGIPENFALNWETTPFIISLMPYSIAYFNRFGNGGCYLGKSC